MAEVVQATMDAMVPSLRDLTARGIFNAVEIRALVEKRRDFEYSLKRRTVRKTDFLLYLEFEMNLLHLFSIRKSNLPKVKPSLCDFCIEQNIHLIFTKAVRKFKFDVAVWNQYIDFSLKHDSNKKLGSIFLEALGIHPRVASLWIKAAEWEYFTNSNSKNARVLLQRALRTNTTSEELYITYFTLELHYIQKLRGRREILQLSGKRSKGMEESDMFNGELPKVIFEQAIKNLSESVGFRLFFLDVLGGFPQTEALEECIMDSIERDFSSDVEAWVARAVHYCDGKDEYAKALDIVVDGIKTVGSSEMAVAGMNFIRNLANENDGDDSVVEMLSSKYAEVISILNSPSSELRLQVVKNSELVFMESEFYINSNQITTAISTLTDHLSTDKLGALPESVDLYILLAGIAARQNGDGDGDGDGDGVGVGDMKQSVKVLQSAMSSIKWTMNSDNLYLKLSRSFLDYLLLSTTSTDVNVNKKIEMVIMKSPPSTITSLALQYLNYQVVQNGVDGMRTVLNFVCKNCMSGDKCDFYTTCLSIEVDVGRRRQVYEIILAETSCTGDRKCAVLKGWEEEEKGRGEVKMAGVIAGRRVSVGGRN